MLFKQFAVLTPALFILSLIPAGAQTASTFPDVPPNHWAYSAVVSLGKKGILIGIPKEYDNSMAEACWKSILKAMERGNEKILRQLMSDEAWQTVASWGNPNRKLSTSLRLIAYEIRCQQRDGFIEWRPVDPSEIGKTSSVIVRSYNGSSDLVFDFQRNKEDWQVVSVRIVY